MTPASALVMRSVCKLYRRRPGRAGGGAGGRPRGLGPLSLDVLPGEAVALVGPNGCGKTTAIKIAAALVEPTCGVAAVFGSDVRSHPFAARRAVGLVLEQTRSFYWRLSALHNLSFNAAVHGLSPRQGARAARRVADEFAVGQHLMMPARRLSRGALARLAVARALMHEPGLLLLDEAFAAADGEARELIWNALWRRMRNGLAVLLATHDPAQVERCARAVAVREPE